LNYIYTFWLFLDKNTKKLKFKNFFPIWIMDIVQPSNLKSDNKNQEKKEIKSLELTMIFGRSKKLVIFENGMKIDDFLLMIK